VENKLNRAWTEIDLDSIAHNIREIKKNIKEDTQIMAAVKADAYGHGVMETSKILIENGVDALAVSMLDEAIQLRRNNIKVPVLVLNHTDPERVTEIIENDLTQTLYSYEMATSISDEAKKRGMEVKVHIKIDTGMGRVGLKAGYSAVKNLLSIAKLPGIVMEGLFTHFATADIKNDEYTKNQFSTFMSICNELSRVGILIPYKHVSNSAAIINYPEMNLDMVRPGIMIYGLYPSNECNDERFDLKPAMSLKAKIIHIKELEKDCSVSYGRTYTTGKTTKVATIPIGYADGYSRTLSNKASVLINGQKAPVIGTICMDQCMVDITDIKGDINIGDEVVLFGKQGNSQINVEEPASLAGTINYEIISILGKRLPRVYIENGKIKNIVNYLIT
jgi:alanine racemase